MVKYDDRIEVRADAALIAAFKRTAARAERSASQELRRLMRLAVETEESQEAMNEERPADGDGARARDPLLLRGEDRGGS